MTLQSRRYWFLRKSYGFGWRPATWEGWVLLFLAVMAAVLNALRVDGLSHSVSDTLINVVPQTLFILALLTIACVLSSERPR